MVSLGGHNAGAPVVAGAASALVDPCLAELALESWRTAAGVALLLVQTGAMLRTAVPDTIVNIDLAVGARIPGQTQAAGEAGNRNCFDEKSEHCLQDHLFYTVGLCGAHYVTKNRSF